MTDPRAIRFMEKFASPDSEISDFLEAVESDFVVPIGGSLLSSEKPEFDIVKEVENQIHSINLELVGHKFHPQSNLELLSVIAMGHFLDYNDTEISRFEKPKKTLFQYISSSRLVEFFSEWMQIVFEKNLEKISKEENRQFYFEVSLRIFEMSLADQYFLIQSYDPEDYVAVSIPELERTFSWVAYFINTMTSRRIATVRKWMEYHSVMSSSDLKFYSIEFLGRMSRTRGAQYGRQENWLVKVGIFDRVITTSKAHWSGLDNMSLESKIVLFS